MNLALGAVLLAILLIPPLILYYSYSSGNYAKAAPKFTVLEYLLASAVLSLIIHCSIIHFWKLDINFEFLFRVLAGQMTEEFVKSSKDNIAHYFHQFALYILKVCIGCAAVGWLFSKLIRMRWLRMNSKVQWLRGGEPPGNTFRYFNKWWYYFRIYEYSSKYQYLGKAKPVTVINILIETKDAYILYAGTLFGWVADGEILDRVYISSPTKRLFSRKSETEGIILSEGDKIKVESDGLLCIPYSRVVNMHVQFVGSIVVVADDGVTVQDEAAIIEAIGEIEEADLNENLESESPQSNDDHLENNSNAGEVA